MQEEISFIKITVAYDTWDILYTVLMQYSAKSECLERKYSMWSVQRSVYRRHQAIRWLRISVVAATHQQLIYRLFNNLHPTETHRSFRSHAGMLTNLVCRNSRKHCLQKTETPDKKFSCMSALVCKKFPLVRLGVSIPSMCPVTIISHNSMLLAVTGFIICRRLNTPTCGTVFCTTQKVLIPALFCVLFL